jgi:hypothetical protein
VAVEPAEESVADTRDGCRPAVVSIDGSEPLMNIQPNAASDPRIRKLLAISHDQ